MAERKIFLRRNGFETLSRNGIDQFAAAIRSKNQSHLRKKSTELASSAPRKMIPMEYAEYSENYDKLLQELTEKAKFERKNKPGFTLNLPWLKQQEKVIESHLTSPQLWTLLASIEKAQKG